MLSAYKPIHGEESLPSRPACEVADIFREYGRSYRMNNKMPLSHMKVMSDIINCRTEFKGGHIEKCDSCGYERNAYNSCRNRHCPKCQTMAKARWLDARMHELLPARYYHEVFTLPHEMNPVILCNKEAIFTILFKAVSETLLLFGWNTRNGLGGKVGFIAILHTWNQVLLDHFHLHCVIPAGALSPDESRWISSRRWRILFNVKALSIVFRAKFIEYLEQAFDKGDLHFPGNTTSYGTQAGFRHLIRKLWSKRWVVYSKRPFAGPEQVLDYLGRYTHRVAISNHRIIALKDGVVTFFYRDRRDNDTKKIMSLDAQEFIRRFLLHVIPEGFMRIRYYGFLANRSKKHNLNLIRRLLGVREELSDTRKESVRDLMLRLTDIDITRCPHCKNGTMRTIAEIPSLQKRHLYIIHNQHMVMNST